MALKKYEEANIQAIADAIREKTDTDKTYDTSEMASGVGEVYEAGMKAENDAFWDVVLASGERPTVDYLFYRWSCEYIRPPHKIIAPEKIGTNKILHMFSNNAKLKIIEKRYFDLSKYIPPTGASDSSNAYHLCSNCSSLEVFEDIGLQGGGYYYTWNSDRKLHTIEVMRCVAEGGYSAPFSNCTSLVNLVIEGEIGTSFPIPHSPLSVASLKNIITHLKDYSGTDKEYTYTVTFKATAFAELEAEGATAEYNGVACTWAELIDNKKWKLTKV